MYLGVESSSLNEEFSQLPLIPAAPEKALPRTYHSVPQAPPDNIELDNLQWGARLTGPTESGLVTPPVAETPIAPNDVETSRPATPTRGSEGFEAMQSVWNPPMNRCRMLAVCTMSFCTGLNDSAPGALIPYIESYVQSFAFIPPSDSDCSLDTTASDMRSFLLSSSPMLWALYQLLSL
jgi:hypothetical protein